MAEDTVLSVVRGLLRLDVTIEGEQQARFGLARMAENVSDFRPFWIDYFAPRFYADIRENFEVEGHRVLDAGWAPLSPSYAAWKESQVGSIPGILQFTYALMESVTDERAPGAIFDPQPDALDIGTSIEYAMQHQRGTDRLPARPFLFIRNDDRYRKDLRAFVTDQWRQYVGVGLTA